MMKYETLPNFSIFHHTSSFFSSRFHNVCYCLLFIKKKKFSSFTFLLYFIKPEGWMWWELSREIHHTNKSSSSGRVTAVNFELFLISHIYIYFFQFILYYCWNHVFNISKKILSTEKVGNMNLGIATHFLRNLWINFWIC